MNNAELFKKVFGIYAEEFWAYPTDEMLNWLTYDATDTNAGDLISRQAAIDELYHVDEYNERSVKVIRNLPSAQQWIPVAERLPENDDWQIVTIKDESADAPYIYSDFGWYLDAANCWIVDADQRRDIVAWMPLPKPWKGGEDGEIH